MIRKYEEFVKKLQTSTDARKITWEETSGGNEYQAAIGNNSVSLKYQSPQDFAITKDDKEGYVSLFLRNSKGDIIDDVKATAGSLDYSKLYNLYGSARRASLKVEETLDEMMKCLE